MRKIDTKSFNKRLFREIMELGSMLERINPEHLKYFDSNLIAAADNYVKLIKDSRWQNNANFNSIEISKIKQAINYLRTNRSILFADREIKVISDPENVDTALGVSIYRVADNNDGRLSFVYPRIAIESKDEKNNVSKRYLNSMEIFLGGVTDITKDCNKWSMPLTGSTNSRLEIVKNKHEINIHYDINMSDRIVYDYSVEEAEYGYEILNSEVINIYLDVLYIMWRKK